MFPLSLTKVAAGRNCRGIVMATAEAAALSSKAPDLAGIHLEHGAN